MLECTDGTIYEAMTLQEAKSIARQLAASALGGHPSSPWQRRTNVWRR
jgi:hypothetical protein